MEEYSDIENDTFDACDASGARDATLATTKSQEQGVELQVQQGSQLDAEIVTKRSGKLGALRATSGNRTIRFKAGEPHHNLQLVRHIEAEEKADRNQLIDMGVFKPTNGNATKRLRMRQETREVTRNSKTAEATLEKIASQEFQAEKGKMQVWKQMIMQEVAHELQIIKESAKAQKEHFEKEMEVVKEQSQEMEAKSMRLEKELGFFKAKEQKSGQHKGKDTSIAKKNLEQPKKKTPESSTEPIEEREVLPIQSRRNKEFTPAQQPSPAKNGQKWNYALVAASKLAQAPENPWTQVMYKNYKS